MEGGRLPDRSVLVSERASERVFLPIYGYPLCSTTMYIQLYIQLYEVLLHREGCVKTDTSHAPARKIPTAYYSCSACMHARLMYTDTPY